MTATQCGSGETLDFRTAGAFEGRPPASATEPGARGAGPPATALDTLAAWDGSGAGSASRGGDGWGRAAIGAGAAERSVRVLPAEEGGGGPGGIVAPVSLAPLPRPSVR